MKDIICQGGERMETVIIAEAGSACGYTQAKGIFVSASTYSWTADNVNITVRGYDGGVGN